MNKLRTYKFIIIVLFLLSAVICYAQPNSYFENNESWAGTSWWTTNQNSFYIQQYGDTTINNDTLIKLIKLNNGSGIDTTYYLAKNDTNYYTQTK